MQAHQASTREQRDKDGGPKQRRGDKPPRKGDHFETTKEDAEKMGFNF